MEQPVKMSNTHLPDIIELRGVKQMYEGREDPIINDFNLLIEDKPNQGQFIVVLGPSGSGKCVAEGTWIIVDEGIRRIEDLFSNKECNDDTVYSVDSKINVKVDSNIEPISHKYYGGLKDTIKITTTNGVVIEGTHVHPLLVFRNGSHQWIKMGDIKSSDMLVQEAYQGLFKSNSYRAPLPRAIPRSYLSANRKILKYKRMGLNNREISKLTNIDPMTVGRHVNNKFGKINNPKFKAPTHMSDDTAYYLGLLSGDGSINNYVGLTTIDSEIKDFFIEYTKQTFNCNVTISHKNGTDALLLRPDGNPFYSEWMRKVFGGACNSDNKDVPKSIRLSSFRHQLAFLQGLMDTDGHSDVDNKRAEISLNSIHLIDFVCNMLSAMGIQYTRSLRGKSHRVSIRQSCNLHKLFRLNRKKQPINSSKSPCDVRIELPIKSIEYSKSKVYDLTNPVSHSFVANSLVVHNSTILRYIAGLQKPTEGEILLYEKPRVKTDRIGMVFQQYSSLPWMTVLDNVALGLQYQNVPKKERRDRAMEMIKKVGLEGHENKWAKYPTLSGGQLQRVAIARSLLYDPKILLMDEPFGALDIETRYQMQDLLAEIWVDIHPTIVFVTHDIPEAVYLGDDIYVMGRDPGNIIGHYRSPLPFKRDRSMKRQNNFRNQVSEIEDFMTGTS